TAADKIMTFKMVVRKVANDHGLHATFMPKPIFGQPGSGMHINQSLFKGGKNAFYDPEGEEGLSEIALQYIAGLMSHVKAITAITNPTVNSYKRIVPEYEAPVHIAWSHHNRSPLIRVPSKRGKSTRIEMRSPDPSTNPYLALAVSLVAGLDGIRNKLTPPAPVDANLYRLTDEQRNALNIDHLPRTLTESLNALKHDSLLLELLGDHASRQYINARESEWEAYSIQVSKWELDRYLNTI
ncbi:MAG: glutamine synthetase, partial [Eubacteriaceae bacterium]|nr:glutamine synthetase [Eubacteriaceae bacterium]